ncbi:SRP40-Suppressor of mutant AC40 of RNA polymerase I and III [Fusarium austroafricanum]|uniref:SRP40-Suppressor of mutant AC40 of RNA polymerase I and III n=1 Tax=Fusarium austroafricanum TaxID=2364996 RepID=A0A8H4K9A3_9HYPO|nr:SRP40-Suppressor of mutant AC40 of RNA polymerase I and III [Fusarium austroafricanum]
MPSNQSKKSPDSKGKAKAKDNPVMPIRQTRARSRLNNAPPLMTGLDYLTGLPKDTLPAEPKTLVYNDVVQKLSDKANTAAKNTASKARRKTKIIFRSSQTASSSSGQSGSSSPSSSSAPLTAGPLNQNQSPSSSSDRSARSPAEYPPTSPTAGPSNQDQSTSPISKQSARNSFSSTRNHSDPDASRSNADTQDSSNSDDSSDESDGSGDAPLGQSRDESSGPGGNSGYEASGEMNPDLSDLYSSSDPGSSQSDASGPGSPDPSRGHSSPLPAALFDGEGKSSGEDADDEQTSRSDTSHSSSGSSRSSGSSEGGAPPDGNIDSDHSEHSANGNPHIRNNPVSTTPQPPETGSPADDPTMPVDPALYAPVLGENEESQDARCPVQRLDTSPTCSGSALWKRKRSPDFNDDAPSFGTKKSRSKTAEIMNRILTATHNSVVSPPSSESFEPFVSTSNSPDSGAHSPIDDSKSAFAKVAISGESSASGEASPMILPIVDPEIPDIYGSGLRPRLHYDWYEQYHFTGLDCAKVHGCTHNPGRVCHPCHAGWQDAWARFFKAEELLQEAAADPERYLKETGLDIRMDFMRALMEDSDWKVLAPELQPPAGGKVRIHPTRAAMHKLALGQVASF